MGELACVVCKRGMKDGVSLRRINAKGVPGLWACARHAGQTDAKPDLELERIVRIIEGRRHG